jgi:hypothetical protein
VAWPSAGGRRRGSGRRLGRKDEVSVWAIWQAKAQGGGRPPKRREGRRVGIGWRPRGRGGGSGPAWRGRRPSACWAGSRWPGTNTMWAGKVA